MCTCTDVLVDEQDRTWLRWRGQDRGRRRRSWSPSCRPFVLTPPRSVLAPSSWPPLVSWPCRLRSLPSSSASSQVCPPRVILARGLPSDFSVDLRVCLLVGGELLETQFGLLAQNPDMYVTLWLWLWVWWLKSYNLTALLLPLDVWCITWLKLEWHCAVLRCWCLMKLIDFLKWVSVHRWMKLWNPCLKKGKYESEREREWEGERVRGRGVRKERGERDRGERKRSQDWPFTPQTNTAVQCDAALCVGRVRTGRPAQPRAHPSGRRGQTQREPQDVLPLLPPSR